MAKSKLKTLELKSLKDQSLYYEYYDEINDDNYNNFSDEYVNEDNFNYNNLFNCKENYESNKLKNILTSACIGPMLGLDIGTSIALGCLF